MSFDGVNISIPVNFRDPDDAVFKPWAHCDQSPLDTGMSCIQGIMNLNHNGPEDGGLIVLKGSSALYAQLYEAFEDKKPAEGWNTKDRHDHTEDQLQWLYDRGCDWEKVCAEPGDLLLWDSVSRRISLLWPSRCSTSRIQRTVHYGATPSAQTDRLAVCE